MDKTVPSFRDEQPARDRWLPLGRNLRGAPGRVHGGVGAGERGGGCREVREVYWEFDVRRGVFLLQDLMKVKRFVFLQFMD